MFNLSDEGVHFQRRYCSTSAARGVQLERYIQSVNTMNEVREMANYREISRLQSLGLNNSQIADACGYSRTTVIKVLELVRANHLSCLLPEGMPDKQLAEVLFPVSTAKPEYKMPDYEYVAREMQRSGVTLNLLWLEYCEQCSNNSESRIS